MNLPQKTLEIYTKTKELFPEEFPKSPYLERKWIFPHHIDIMLKIIDNLCEKYGGDKDICQIAAILHDTGLVYKRTDSSPTGHEERSVEYARNLLSEFKYEEETLKKIIECIEVSPAKTINAKIVKTADALSKFTSCHFIAKAVFSNNLIHYMQWLSKKIETSFEIILF